MPEPERGASFFVLRIPWHCRFHIIRIGMPIDPEKGFTSSVISDPHRFIGRAGELRDCAKALNSSLSLLSVYGKRGVGKSSLLRQVQQMALGDYRLLREAGLQHEFSAKTRTYLTVYYTCDSTITNVEHLLQKLCNDQDGKDGLLRLLPDDGKELVETVRTAEAEGGLDLQLVKWGVKGASASKYARVVENDIVQTFRNFCSSIIQHQVKNRMKRDGLLILLDEFDVIQDKSHFGSLVKSLTTDMQELVTDHGSVERLLEEGAIRVREMSEAEITKIFDRAHELYNGEVTFVRQTVQNIYKFSQGYPYLAQLIGKECLHECNRRSSKVVDEEILESVKNDIASGRAFPTLESQYQRAIGESEDRKILLHFLAEQEGTDINDEQHGRVLLRKLRADASDLGIAFVDQLIPRLVDRNFGPVLYRHTEKPGVYEFENPIFRLYVKLRHY
jgi:hypothetical protein